MLSHPLRRALVLVAALLVAPPAASAEDGPRIVQFAGDTYARGAEPELPPGETGSLFAVGETVRSQTTASGSVHLAGRRVAVRAPVGGDLYAGGYEVDVEAPVAGDANLAGRVLRVEAPVGGVLRALANDLTVDAPVGAILAGARRFRLDAVVTGDVQVSADEVEFGPNARIDGRLILSEGRGLRVPERIVPAERVQRRDADFGHGMARGGTATVVLGVIASLLLGAAAVLAAQAILLGAAPRWSEDLAFDVAERPFRSFGAGFLTMAAVFGAIPLLAVTLIGIPLVFVVLALAPLALLAGYALGTWALGAAVWRAMDRPAPLTFWARMGIAVLGLAAAALLGLVPVLGWLVGVVLTLTGVGAASAKLLAGRRP